MRLNYDGESRDFKSTGNAIYMTFLLALVIAYLVLSAQFESFRHPLIIMATVPLAISGALFGLVIFGSTLNIYSQIGLIMLVGLAAKIREVVGEHPCYLTFDIDCLDPAFAPGTGTPVCGGLSSHQALEIIRGLGGLRYVGADLVEVAPAYDSGDITAFAGASLATEFLCLFASDPSRAGEGAA